MVVQMQEFTFLRILIEGMDYHFQEIAVNEFHSCVVVSRKGEMPKRVKGEFTHKNYF